MARGKNYYSAAELSIVFFTVVSLKITIMYISITKALCTLITHIDYF
jgi:hypothetical protein